MDIHDIYNDPLLYLKRQGVSGDPYREITETLQVINGQVILNEIPNRFDRVVANGNYYEVDNDELTPDTFRVNYTYGNIYFDSSQNGKSITFTYLGTGVVLIPTARVYVEKNGWSLKDKLADLDRMDLMQKNRVDNLIKNNPQPSEIVDARTDRNGKVYNVLKDRHDAEQKIVEDAFTDLNKKKYIDLASRLNADQKIVDDAFAPSDGTTIKKDLHTRIKYDYDKTRTYINTEITSLSNKVDGQITDLTNTMNTELDKLNKKIERQVNVLDYGAKGDGKTDDTEAIKKALASGNRKVYIPSGTYRVSTVKIPSNTIVYGDGMSTIIKLIDSAPNTTNLVTNSNYSGGNNHIVVEDLMIDWNQNRSQGTVPITTGNPDGCGFILINTKYAWINRVKSIDAGRHCFDVSANKYHHDGDSPTVYESDGCKYIWFNQCLASGAGDDNFTTHFSDYVWIKDCISMNPSGILFSKTKANTNCFEIDDGSRHVIVEGCYAYGGSRGFESKAHHHSPAPQDVKFINCIAENSIRTFDIRHVGFLHSDEPDSATAYNVEIINCTAINPATKTYKSLAPRALAIASYRNVNVSNFTAIGGKDEVKGEVISLYQNSQNINLNNITIRNFTKAKTDIRLVGSTSTSKRTSGVNISNVTLLNSALRGIAIGKQIEDCMISNVVARNNNRSGSIGIATARSKVAILNIDMQGYQTITKIGKSGKSNVNQTRIKDAVVMATTRGNATHNQSAVIASTGFSEASGDKSMVVSSSTSKATGERSFVASSGTNSESKGAYSSVLASRSSVALGARSTVVSSYNVINPQGNSIAGGWNDTGSPSSGNRKWQLNSANGNITSVGSVTGGSTFSDYAEYFESMDGSKIPTGLIVTLDGDRIRLAKKGEQMLGVISETAGVVLGESSFAWKGKYLKNEFGGLIYEDREVEESDENGNIVKRVMSLPKLNPKYVEDEYDSRSERDEWNIVGLLGQVYIRIDDTVSVGDNIVANNGIATKSEDNDGWKVMKITSSFVKEKGYGVALCFIR